MKHLLVTITFLAAILGSTAAAIDPAGKPAATFEIRFEQHRFSPEKLEVPAGVPLTLHVVNASKERIEFESFKLYREKVVEPRATLVLRLQPLHPGSYDFFDDFHADVPEGTIVAR